MVKYINKHNVRIIDTDESWGPCGRESLRCKPMATQEIKAYIDEIECYNSIPSDSCLYSVHFDFQDMFQQSFFITSNPILSSANGQCSGGYERSEGNLNICVKMKTGCKCSPKDCFKNIKNGKCTDDFVRKLIGEKLFADKYSKVK